MEVVLFGVVEVELCLSGGRVVWLASVRYLSFGRATISFNTLYIMVRWHFSSDLYPSCSNMEDTLLV